MQIQVRNEDIIKIPSNEVLGIAQADDVAKANGYVYAYQFINAFKGKKLQLSNTLKIQSTLL